MAYNEDSSASGHDEPWIQWFCGLKGHEMFCEVERSYIEDGFNLYGLRACVSNFSDCLDLILDRIGPDDSDDSHLTQSACTLYGLIHARFIITAHGLDSMYNKVRYGIVSQKEVMLVLIFVCNIHSLLVFLSMPQRNSALALLHNAMVNLFYPLDYGMILVQTLSKHFVRSASVSTILHQSGRGALTTAQVITQAVDLLMEQPLAPHFLIFS